MSCKTHSWSARLKPLLYMSAMLGGASLAEATAPFGGGLPLTESERQRAPLDQKPPVAARETAAESPRPAPEAAEPAKDTRGANADDARPEAERQRGDRSHAALASDEGKIANAEPTVVTDEPIREDAAPHDPLGEHLRDGLIITGATPHRLLLFSFDDGPDLDTTPLLLDRLDETGVKALFFLTAGRIAGRNPYERRQAALAKEIVERGHMIGNHTVDHVQLPLLDDDAVRAELAASEAIFEDLFGGRPWLMRPPFGAHSERVDFHLAARDYTTILWNLGSGDFQVRTAQEVFELWLRVFERREREHGERGGIILLHDTHPWSVDAFQLIHEWVMEQNCALFDRGEELFDIVDDPAFFYTERAGQRPATEAPPATLPDSVLAERQARLRELTRKRCTSLASL